jgi:lantibiotic modifying enzyme
MQELEAQTRSSLSHDSVIRSPQVRWRSFLDTPLATRAQEAALFVAQQMRDPEHVYEIADMARQQSRYPAGWFPPDVSSGGAGLALMYSYIEACFPGQGWNLLVQRYLRLAAAATHDMPLTNPVLFGGTAGLALTLSLASHEEKRYQKTAAQLNENLCEQVMELRWWRSEAEKGVASNDFDVISGAAGILAYLVSIRQITPTTQAAIARLLAYLLWLGEPGQTLGKERWFIPPELLPNEQHRESSPQGNFNCGLAHGLPGPLVALSLTWLAGYRAPGLQEAIAYLADWLLEHHLEQEWGITWPDSVPLEYAAGPQKWQLLRSTRSGWCYGAPGVARSLWLAGCALEDEHLRKKGVEAVEAALRRPVSERFLPAPTLCHGVGGLLQICLRFAQECESALIKEQIPVLTEQILEMFDPSSSLGFRDIELDGIVDQPGWLTGAPGVAMVLLAAATDTRPDWDRLLAIA